MSFPCLCGGVRQMLNRILGRCFYPNDIDVCQRVFDQVCKEQQLDHSSPKAEAVAATLFSMFQNGCSDEAALLKVFRKARPEKG